MDGKFNLLYKGIKNPIKALRYISALVDNKLKLTENAKVSEGGERLIIKNWHSAKNSRDFVTLAHIKRYEWVLHHINGLQCLDAGCGSGYGTYYLAKNDVSRIIGVDISSDAIKFAKKHWKEENLEFIQMDARNLKFRDNFFDAIISFDVLEHLDEVYQNKFISELSRVLNVGGTLYIGCPNATVSLGNNSHHLKELTKIEFECLLQKYYGNIKILGQEISINSKRQKENWFKCLSNLSYQNIIVVEEDLDFTFGLIAICKNPKK